MNARAWMPSAALTAAALCSVGGAPAYAASSAIRLSVSYRGGGTYHTVYRSHPPNPGGRPDSDSASDSSSQRWSLRFTDPLTVGNCARAGCSSTLLGATGSTSSAGRIDHVHRDGLFRQLDAAARCRVAYATPRGERLRAAIRFSYSRTGLLTIVALDPVSEAVELLPQSCPGQGDSIDGIGDNYFDPGFSSAPGWGPARWFRSKPMSVRVSLIQRQGIVRLRVAGDPAGRPPRGCAVRHSFESCTTGGSWTGTLTLTLKR
jgi:hypothetical protein